MIKPDPFHAMQRLSKLVFKSHGACRAFLTRLRDAFFKVYRSDLVEVETALRQQGKSDAEIETSKEQNWDYFLSLYRRLGWQSSLGRLKLRVECTNCVLAEVKCSAAQIRSLFMPIVMISLTALAYLNTW